MKYMLLIHEDESAYAGDNGEAVLAATLAGHMKLMEELGAAGVAFSGERLREAHTATTIRYESGGEGTQHDGPFAETHEELGGFYLIEAKDHDEAVRWARMIPIPGNGAVEIRPVWQD
ncbi:MAG: hypothetical protein CL803_03305 [Citromicrobium sp.]|nr:hypothetical protein [Citromicrobium sp.]MAO95400.1 hypothetical protein [Citromicrobium sp.]MAS85778.1 hypothetical protein [Erythrobacteraceae bacterium]MBT45957.1 hypothetical protein [Citromicrobium sp.]|tara:strand:+ start:11461 stop:11814 length:354 start_codon:yes stop_codon:yes gene_type:complete